MTEIVWERTGGKTHRVTVYEPDRAAVQEAAEQRLNAVYSAQAGISMWADSMRQQYLESIAEGGQRLLGMAPQRGLGALC